MEHRFDMEHDRLTDDSRKLTSSEFEVVQKLLSVLSEDSERYSNQLKTIRVITMKDGGMGSIRFLADDHCVRRRAHEIAIGKFKDTDGILVSLELTVDQFGHLFELDCWKVDFSELKTWPALNTIEVSAA